MVKKKISYNTQLPQLNDESLYLLGEESVYKALEVAKQLDEKYTKPECVNFYLYWIGDNLSDKHETSIKSFLATQNLDYCQLHIYSDVDLSKNKFIEKYLQHPYNIYVHKFNLYEEVKGTPLENCKWNELIYKHQLNPALESDYFRILMLYKYGGVYLDFDILLLKDLSPLLNYEWVYQWGSEPDRMNGAIMRLKRFSNISKKHLEVIKDKVPILHSLCWADEIYQDVREIYDDLIVFPGAFFNPEWQGAGDSNTFFKCCSESNKLFPGSFAWHFHNKWNQPIEFGSKFDILRNIINSKLNKRFNS